MHGKTKYTADFKHFDYVNPDAPKGGTVKLGTVGRGGGYDSFNPFIVKGISAAGVHYVYDTLTQQAMDEAFTEYGHIAKKIEIPEDRSWVVFHLNPKAKFHDGHPVTAEDIAFSFNTLVKHGQPFYAAYYNDVDHIEILDKHRIKFVFKTNQNKELPLILGQLSVLPKHYWQDKDFTKTSLEPPLGSGPYKIKSFQPGRSVTYERVKDYWARNLPTSIGMYNFDEIVYEYYLDNTVALEAFKSGEFDFRRENSSKNWATAYIGDAFDNGTLLKEEIKHENPTGMQAFIFNTRKPVFSDPVVRQALGYAFDFEWTNKNLFYGAYSRTTSYFSNSELAASGLPAGEELAILKKYQDQLPAELFTTPFTVPTTRGDGNIRHNLRTAIELLRQAGWSIKNNRMVNRQTGQRLAFEILLISKDFERVVQPFVQNLKKIGVAVTIRLVDASQYVNRIRNFDFDCIVYTIPQSNSPGNEQIGYWHSSKADVPGSRNIIGVTSPVVDKLIQLVINAKDREQLIQRTRALDRVLLWGHYVIPQWHNRSYRIAHKKELKRPKTAPKYRLGFDTWWLQN
ncbi:MAG: hypothetical protein CSA50_07610 [Gammaproteobacteria bacterium]|nr:MAG: hypothetical protein CSA50_07610 [Gammaproteobacteria bacterium]